MYKLLFILLLFSSTATSQSKKDLETELKYTKAKLDSIQNLFFQQQTLYQQKIFQLESIIDKVKFVLNNATPVSNNTTVPTLATNSEINKIDKEESKQINNAKFGEGDGLTPKTGAKIYTGPRGGHYYINKNGNKTYIKKK